MEKEYLTATQISRDYEIPLGTVKSRLRSKYSRGRWKVCRRDGKFCVERMDVVHYWLRHMPPGPVAESPEVTFNDMGDYIKSGVDGAVVFDIPAIPPSANHAYSMKSSRGKIIRFPGKALKAWRKEVANQPMKSIDPCDWYGCYIEFSLPIFYKNGKHRKKDLDNMVKYALDEVCGRTLRGGRSLDDSRIKAQCVQKLQAEEENTLIYLFPLRG